MEIGCSGRLPLPSVGGVDWQSQLSVVAGDELKFTMRLHPDLHGSVDSSKPLTTFIWGKVHSQHELSVVDIRQPDPEKDPELLEGRYTCQHPTEVCTVSVFAIAASGRRQVKIGHRRHRVVQSELFMNLTVVSSAGLENAHAPLFIRRTPTALSGSWEERRPCGSHDLAYPQGQWLSQEAAGLTTPERRMSQAQVFSGWTFDVAGCRIPRVDIAASAVWIVVLGTSTDRGVFQSLVDMLLPAEGKINITESELEKCWGYYDVSAGGVRLTYQDMRIQIPFSMENDATGESVCHNDKVVTTDAAALTLNASRFLTEYIFRPGAERYPDVIFSNPLGLWDTPSTTADFAEDVANRVRPLAARLPDFWTGRWVISVYEGPLLRFPASSTWPMNPRLGEALGGPFANDHKRSSHRHYIGDALKRAQARVEKTIDQRIQLTTVLPFYLPKLEEVDGNGGFTFHSLHHHDIHPATIGCGAVSSGENRVCSDVLQFMGFVLLHAATATGSSSIVNRVRVRALGSFDSGSPQPHQALRGGGRDRGGWANLPATTHPVQLCGDCPSSYAPFHVKVPPTPKCVTAMGLPKNTVVHKVWQSTVQPCAQWCLDTVKPKLKPTGSGSVEERLCRVSNGSAPNG